MNFGFPLSLVGHVRCTRDGAALAADPVSAFDADLASIRQGSLVCTACAGAYPIEEGILDMLRHSEVNGEVSRAEQAVRNREALEIDKAAPPAYDNADHRVEMGTTLKAVSPESGGVLLELGCGDGRYSVRLAKLAPSTLALDFSREALAVLRSRLGGAKNVGLVLADVTDFRVAPASFGRVFSTLTSNLPTREHREALYALAARAVHPTGRCVFSTHHQGVHEWLGNVPKSGNYREGGIYRYNFSMGELRDELRAHFPHVAVVPVRVYLPFATRLRVPLRLQSWIGERVPGLDRLAELLLCIAGHRRVVSRWRNKWVPALGALLAGLAWTLLDEV
jgi:SAM-dependent methyltransferase